MKTVGYICLSPISNPKYKGYYVGNKVSLTTSVLPNYATNKNIEWSSILTEALNAETYKQVVPAYYDTALKVKLSRDAESAAMLDLLMESRVFDFGYMYNTGIAFIVQDMVSTNKNNTESAFNSKYKSAEKEWAKIIDTYLALTDAE